MNEAELEAELANAVAEAHNTGFERGRWKERAEKAVADALTAYARVVEDAAMVACSWQNETGTDIAAAARICPEISTAIRALAPDPEDSK